VVTHHRKRVPHISDDAAKPAGGPRYDRGSYGARSEAEAAPAGGGKPALQVDVARKIIFTGDMHLIVDELDAIIPKVQQIVTDANGYFSQSDIQIRTNNRRDGDYTLRVPVEQYESVRTACSKLGSVTRNSSRSEDVTEEYADLEARIKVLKAEEAALAELLKRESAKLDDLLKVREQLVRNREQIEKAEGRTRLLANKASFSTIRLTIEEKKDYVPPSEETFGGTAGNAFTNSWQALVNVGKFIAIVAVSLVPWLPILALIVGLIWWQVRRLKRKTKATPEKSAVG
jgi:Domain of unknown function (DUF4349)